MINVTGGTISPPYDFSYGWEEVTVTCGGERNHRLASWYSNGLGFNRLELLEQDEEAGKRVIRRQLEWNDVTYSKATANSEALAKLLFRRWVGISYDDAMAEHGRMHVADPYGGPSNYV